MLSVIGLFKLTKGALVVALALGLLRLGQEGLAGALARWATRLHFDPDGRHFARAVGAIAALDGQQLRVVSAVLCVYGALFLTEGTGLVLRRRWAEYFTVIVTGSFIPLELYEISRHVSTTRLTIVGINVAVVWYLIVVLRRDARG